MQPSVKGLPNVINTPVLPETVGQFTGLIDGYKGDIIKAEHKEDGEEIVGVLVWDEETFGWGLKLPDWTMGLQCLIDCFKGIEIIGNIHENPSLLEPPDIKE